jgi:hypothetical protein
MFSGPTAAEPVEFTVVCLMSRLALGASAMEAPSPALLTYIRSGKLLHVGHAIPRPLHRSREGDNAVAGVMFGEDGKVVTASKALHDAPPVPDLHSFCLALFGTILPALADRPAAMQEWIALGRTALELERQYKSWPVAYDYVVQLLHERVPQGAGFATPSPSCLQTVAYARAASSDGGPSGAATNAGSTRAADKTSQACFNFNARFPCKSGSMDTCPFGHFCSTCKRAGHIAPDCTQVLSRPSVRGGGGGGRSGRGGRGGGSVVTAPAASTPSAPASKA